MSFQALIAAFVFAAISYVNFFVLTSSFFTILTGIATAIIALFALVASIMMLLSKPQETEEVNSTEQATPNINNKE
ncbi:hypothetical protein [Entomomonas asaccharolytica]|uniref:Uncharacterized protein n=1 Tax=Entomomonas asaccharolytica TaxID=2785331 RepID=A0A974RXC1_9GAMM|nr:hypothetical protein [Entomomonas asaccharolytica]QQP86073.1 hypothetical protein JHT90_02115 [Entomomonas asaccharolytica]